MSGRVVFMMSVGENGGGKGLRLVDAPAVSFPLAEHPIPKGDLISDFCPRGTSRRHGESAVMTHEGFKDTPLAASRPAPVTVSPLARHCTLRYCSANRAADMRRLALSLPLYLHYDSRTGAVSHTIHHTTAAVASPITSPLL